MESSGANTNEECGEGSILKLSGLAKVRLMIYVLICLSQNARLIGNSQTGNVCVER
jgi:hypothetical protein